MIYNSGKIYTGLAIFVLFITFPIWYNHFDASGADQLKKELQKPTVSKECVAPAAEMKASHMKLLNQWRDEVLRDGDREFNVPVEGKMYQKSLQKTCMKCHTSKKKFCDVCHEYASVTPYCWDCHLAPVE
ncbi:MAG: sulfate reduction electron transfer complex DsrMKJOP subunit DsrJ [Desulfobulbaceae bacterium]|nr:sulfate reduction electron transfer complex DsrMKJOP subunit DsrJ [Desulfobulbaceae bacterium]